MYLYYIHHRGKEKTIKINYRPQDSGIYYVVTAVLVWIVLFSYSCDYHVSPLVMDGMMTVENPYGHLPAPQYGDLPFVTCMFFVYLICFIVWGMLCIRYSKEIMSVQILILIVLVAFAINYLVKAIYYNVYNKSGNNIFVLSVLSILADCTARAFTRILTLIVCMG